MNVDAYFETRVVEDPRREALWKTLCDTWFSPRLKEGATVVELGCGYGHFINNIKAARRIAVDIWPGSLRYLAPGVEGHTGSIEDLSFLEDSSVDMAFASNLFEHVTQHVFASVLAQMRRKLRAGGSVVVLQPNYRYAYKEYFDDYTHITVYSDISLTDFLAANGFTVRESHPRFLPLTVKSRLPVSPLLIRAYLASPLKPMGKQMLICAEPTQR